jgi:HlyD family secretion protein
LDQGDFFVKRKAFFFLISVILIGAGLFAYKKFHSKSSVQVLETALVEKGSIRGVLVETGIVKPQVGALVKIGSRITGTIVEMNVKIGDKVKKGDIIARIDDREILKSIDRQKASLDSARRTLNQIELTYPRRIAEARANYNYAKIDYEREQKLIKKEYTTQDAVDKARSQYKAAEATLKLNEEEYRTQPEIARANVEENLAHLKQLEVNLTYTKIVAPIDGVISDVTAQEGETIVTGLQVANLVTVLDPTSLEMWIYVDETDIGKLKIGQEVEYYVDTFPDKLFRGVVNKVYPEPVTKDNIVYYLAIVQVPKDDTEFLKPEMTTHVKVIFQEKKDILTAPNAAVKFEEGRQVVYKVVGPNKVEKIVLTTGLRGEDKTEILSGVSEGDQLATKIILPVASTP